jgi:hypothetical protein
MIYPFIVVFFHGLGFCPPILFYFDKEFSRLCKNKLISNLKIVFKWNFFFWYSFKWNFCCLVWVNYLKSVHVISTSRDKIKLKSHLKKLKIVVANVNNFPVNSFLFFLKINKLSTYFFPPGVVNWDNNLFGTITNRSLFHLCQSFAKFQLSLGLQNESWHK